MKGSPDIFWNIEKLVLKHSHHIPCSTHIPLDYDIKSCLCPHQGVAGSCGTEPEDNCLAH